MALLIVVSLAARLLFAASLGLGIDESYMVAAGRHLHLSYFDHPPISWWMVWGAAHLFGTDAGFVVRLPFVLLFGVSTWLMFRLGETLFGARAGLWAACLMNAAPVLGVTTGSWVLPDGPLIAFMLGACLALVRAIDAEGRRAWICWLAAGLCLGLAMDSKYSAALTAAGAGLYFLTDREARRWFLRPQPYVAVALAVLLFTPVLIWNARHGWVSFAFQGGRAVGHKWHPFGPVTTLAGEALFMLPWIWVPLMMMFGRALRDGPARRWPWFLACLAAPSVFLFPIVALRSHVLFHWAAPGTMMLMPLLGDAIRRRGDTRAGPWLAVTAVTILVGCALVGTEVSFNWMPEVFEDFALGKDPDLAAVDWTSLRQALIERHMLRPGLVVAATRWHDAGKVDYALGGRARVICLGNDPREYGITARAGEFDGRNVLIVAPRDTLASVTRAYGDQFASIRALKPVILEHAGRPAMVLPLFLGRDLSVAR